MRRAAEQAQGGCPCCRGRGGSGGPARGLWTQKRVSRGMWGGEWAGGTSSLPPESSTSLGGPTVLPSLPHPLQPESSPWVGLNPPSPPSMGPVAGLSPNSNLSTLLSPTLAFTPQLRAKFCLFPEPTVPRVAPASGQASLQVPLSKATFLSKTVQPVHREGTRNDPEAKEKTAKLSLGETHKSYTLARFSLPSQTSRDQRAREPGAWGG